MIRSMKSLGFLGAALLLTLGLQEGRANACTFKCQLVSTNCRRCVDTFSPTGQTCQNSGSCNCFYTQNECGLRVAGVKPEALQAAIFALPEAPEPAPALDLAALGLAR